MKRISNDEATAVLGRWIGTAQLKLVGEGMEGAVYEIDDNRVAKVWHAASADALRRTASFYEAMNAKPVPFAVPRILGIEQIGDRIVTVERRLAGTTMLAALATGAIGHEAAYEVFVGVVAELAAAGELPAARELVVLGEDASPYAADEDFPEALARLADRRIELYRPVLSRVVDRLDEKSAALAARLREVDSGRRSVVHGDLFPGNILVDDAGTSSAVLDWGFLTTEGDPAFDAAIAAAIYDMYGPDARRNERDLVERIQARLGYHHDAMLVYRAAYSLITANVYDPAGKDGHFAWCVAALNRADITDALLG